jgi:glycosyltransferase involved in cell wall biosynthesis
MIDIQAPTLSIICFAFNHEKFIKHALEGFVTQKTNFPFEIVIHDDASTDKTADIIREYEAKYPDLFKPIFQKINQFSLEKGRVTKICYAAAKGKYIAICEGDDYWTDPLKLQKQVVFLEKNPEYNFSLGAYNTIDEKGKIELGESVRKKTNNLLIRDYIAKRFSQTSTFVFRNNFELPNWLSQVYAGDQALLLLATKDKKIKYHKEVFSVYRLHSRGIDTLYNNYFERNMKYIFLLKKIKFLTNDWKCKLLINLKIHIITIKNYSLNTWFENIIKVYTGFLNKVVVRFINWILRLK